MKEQIIHDINCIASTWPPDPEKITLLFIHGSGNTRRLWKKQVSGLSDAANVIAIDLPGHGNSPGNGCDSITAYAGVVEKFIADAGLNRVIPCGLSLGGAIALQIILDASEKYPALVLVNSGARLRVLPAIFETIRNHYSGYVSSLATMAASEKCDKKLLDDILDDARDCAPDVVLNDFTACNHFDVMERLREIEMPVLVLSADEDRLSPIKYGAYLADNISAAVHVTIEEAGHMSPVEKPGAVNDAIRGFLKSL